MSGKTRIPVLTSEKIQKDFKVTWCKKIATVEHLHTNKKMCIQMGQINLRKMQEKLLPFFLEIYREESASNQGLKDAVIAVAAFTCLYWPIGTAACAGAGAILGASALGF